MLCPFFVKNIMNFKRVGKFNVCFSFILDIMWHFVPTQVIDHGRKNPTMHAYQLHVGPMRPTRYGFT